MKIEIKELSDNRFIGFGVFEIASFPAYEETEKNDKLQKLYSTFVSIIQEYYKLAVNSEVVAEFIWLTDKVEKQTFRSKIRLMCAVRKISGQVPAGLNDDINNLLNHFSLAIAANQFRVDITDKPYDDYLMLMKTVADDCVFSVTKAEKLAGNSASMYPYYYCDVVAADNYDNFASLVATLCQHTDCCLAFQIFPTLLSNQERIYLNEVTGELGRLKSGVFMERGIYRDNAAEQPYTALNHYQQHANSPLFLYNILIFGKKTDCVDIAAKVVSLLQAGATKIMNSDFSCLDLSAEKIDLSASYLQYPWNVNNKMVYTYRNKKIQANVPMASILFRLPNIVTAEEAAAFFRLPYREKTMAALPSNQADLNSEEFDAAVIAEDNIKFGRLISHDWQDIIIGCPLNTFTKHALVVGTTGTGKTTFALNILLQFAKRGIPFLAIEPTKAEYRALIDEIPDIQIFTPGNNAVSPFIINPFIPPQGITIEQYIPSLASAFKAAFSMPAPLDILFLRAVRSCYSENGWKDYSKYGDEDVSVFGLYEFILTFKRTVNESDYSSEIKGNLQSAGVFRLMNLIEQNSNIFDTINTVPIEDMLKKPTVLELVAIDNTEQKALIIALLLISIGVYTKNNNIGDGQLKNIIMIDEAHVLLGGSFSVGQDGADSQGVTIKSLQDMIAEIRAYGTGIIIADQSPSKVSREVIANTDIKISFRLVQAAEKELIQDSTNMDKAVAAKLSKLKLGEAYAYFSRLESPQLIMTEDVREKENLRLNVPNHEIKARMTYWDDKQDQLKPFAECLYNQQCRGGCDFALRAKADYYANKLVLACKSKLKSPQDLAAYLLGTEKLISNIIDVTEEVERARLIKCTMIRFLRKIQLNTTVRLSKNDSKKVLSTVK